MKTINVSALLIACMLAMSPTQTKPVPTSLVIGTVAVVTVLGINAYMKYKEEHKNDWMQSSDPETLFKGIADTTERIKKDVERMMGK